MNELARPRGPQLLLLGISLLWSPSALVGADQTTLVVDHETRRAYLNESDNAIRNGDERRVHISVPVVVKVINTNTALYTFQTTGEKIEAKEIADLRGFLKALGPYLVEGAAQSEPRKRVPGAVSLDGRGKKYKDPTLEKKLTEIRGSLLAIDEALFGPKGILDTELRVFETLGKMRQCLEGTLASSNMTLVDELTVGIEGRLGEKQSVQDTCGESLTRYSHLTALDTIRKALAVLISAVTQADNLSQNDVLTDPDEELLLEARKAMGDAESLRSAALRIESLAQRTLEARSVWCSEEYPVSASKGVTLTILVSGAKEADLAPLADRPDFQLQVSLVPDWLARPALGLAFLYSPDSTFPKFGTSKDGEKFKIVRPDAQDSRFTYGLTLGLTWRGLDWRQKYGAALWIPELTVNPSSDVRAVGVGVAFSWWKILKVGVGWLWTKHKVLDGLAETDRLDAAEDLRLRDSYPDGRWYLSISLIGWPPFVSE
jgi:hypothetical protein